MTISRRQFWLLLLCCVGVRLLSLAAYPLMDTTEARYGEMARLMVETGNWLTPQFDYGVPFWGKPPLFTWMSASGVTFLGLSEFALRFPHWLAGMATLLLIGGFARAQQLSWRASVLILASCGIFSIASGAMMTDMALTFSLSLAIIGFYQCWMGKVAWGYAGFIGLALGLLAKGPLVLVLFALAVVPWVIFHYGFATGTRLLIKRVPLLSGTLLMLAIALPWYLLAEQATPGFLDYFIMGEHVNRFLVSGWEGDLYGNAHDEPKGMIWLFWLAVAAPWSFVLLALVLKRRYDLHWMSGQHAKLASLFVLWLLAPMVLFTFAGNILAAYTLPSMPALALLIPMLLKHDDWAWFRWCTLLVPTLLIIAVVVLNTGVAESRSDRNLLMDIQPDIALFYAEKRPFSGQYYSQGQAMLLTDNKQLQGLPHYYLVGQPKYVAPWLRLSSLDCILEMATESGRARYLCQ